MVEYYSMNMLKSFWLYYWLVAQKRHPRERATLTAVGKSPVHTAVAPYSLAPSLSTWTKLVMTSPVLCGRATTRSLLRIEPRRLFRNGKAGLEEATISFTNDAGCHQRQQPTRYVSQPCKSPIISSISLLHRDCTGFRRNAMLRIVLRMEI